MATKAQVRVLAENGQHDAPKDAAPRTHAVDGVEHAMRGYDDLDWKRFHRFTALSKKLPDVIDDLDLVDLDNDDAGSGEFDLQFQRIYLALARMALPTVERERFEAMHPFEVVNIVNTFVQYVNTSAEGKPGAQLLRPTQTA